MDRNDVQAGVRYGPLTCGRRDRSVHRQWRAAPNSRLRSSAAAVLLGLHAELHSQLLSLLSTRLRLIREARPRSLSAQRLVTPSRPMMCSIVVVERVRSAIAATRPTPGPRPARPCTRRRLPILPRMLAPTLFPLLPLPPSLIASSPPCLLFLTLLPRPSCLPNPRAVCGLATGIGAEPPLPPWIIPLPKLDAAMLTVLIDRSRRCHRLVTPPDMKRPSRKFPEGRYGSLVLCYDPFLQRYINEPSHVRG